MLTQLNGIDGVESSSALLSDDGRRLVQITVRPGATPTDVVEKVRSSLRTQVRSETPSLLEGKSAEAVEAKQDWLTLGQLHTLAAEEESSSRRLDNRYWLLALSGVLTLCALLFWLVRRPRKVGAEAKSVSAGRMPRLPPQQRLRTKS